MCRVRGAPQPAEGRAPRPPTTDRRARRSALAEGPALWRPRTGTRSTSSLCF